MQDKENQQLKNTLLAGNFEKAQPQTHTLSDPLEDTFMIVTLDQLRPYDRNPRKTRNPKYDVIKQSIKERGLDAPPPITRRPGQEHFMIRNGGNTRLSILEELWSETRDEQFFRIGCLFRPWTGEITLLTGHLAEGELHGDLTFIEKALGVLDTKVQIEADSGTTISQRALVQKLIENGYPISQPMISRMIETVTILLPVIPNLLYSGLGSKNVIALLALNNAIARTWTKYSQANVATYINEEAIEFFQELLLPFDGDRESFKIERLRDEAIAQLSERFKTPYDLIALEILEDESRQKALSTPPLPHVKEIVPINAITHKQEQTTNNVASHDTTGVNTPASESNVIKNHVTDDDEDSIQATSSDDSQTITPSDRVETIQNLVAKALGVNGENTPETDRLSLPAHAEGLYKVVDIWKINITQDTPNGLRAMIVQLAGEIAYEYGMAKYIQEADAFPGYECLPLESEIPSSLIIHLLHSLTLVAPDISLQQLGIPFLFYGHKNEDLQLSDNALVKVFRIIRLSRRLYELEKEDLTHINS